MFNVIYALIGIAGLLLIVVAIDIYVGFKKVRKTS